MKMKNWIINRGGFTLVEMITSIVLLGIIGVFTSLFLYTGIKGYMVTRQTNEGAMKAQIALDRINLELRKINTLSTVSPPVVDTSISYTSDDLPGNRRIVYDSNAKTISIFVDGQAYVLLEDGAGFTLNWQVADLDNSADGNDEIATLEIGFTMADIGRPFNLKIYPRSWLPEPP